MTLQGRGTIYDTNAVGRRKIRNDVWEPATFALLGLGLAGLSAVRRRKS